MTVKRYARINHGSGCWSMGEWPDGEYVRYDDYAALQQQLNALAAEGAIMLRLLTDISEQYEEVQTEGDENAAVIDLDYISEINSHVSRDVDAENPFVATDAAIRELQAQGVDMVKTHPAISLCSLTHVCDEVAAALRNGEQGGDHV